jgi:hypothetical protein
VFIEIIEGLWNSRLGKIRGRRDKHQPEGSEPSCLQARISKCPDTQDDVETFLDQIHVAVGEAQIEFDIRELSREVKQGLMPQFVDQRKAHLELSSRHLARESEIVFGIGDLPHDAPATLEKPRPFCGQTYAPGAAVKQAYTKSLFEADDSLAHCGSGLAEDFPCSHVAA